MRNFIFTNENNIGILKKKDYKGNSHGVYTTKINEASGSYDKTRSECWVEGETKRTSWVGGGKSI